MTPSCDSKSLPEAELTITDLAFGGEGLARHEGMVVFIPFTTLGDRIRARITRQHKTYWRGELLEVLSPGEGRIEPPCPYFGTCGGCQYQHIAYELELQAKEKQLRDILTRIGKIQSPHILPILHREPYSYRNRITVHNEQGRIGFRPLKGRRLIDVQECLLATNEVNRKLQKLRTRPRPRPHYSVRADSVAGEAFHQVNETLAPVLQQAVSDALHPDAQALVEGYAGTGFFTQKLDERLRSIIAIESESTAVSAARLLPLENTRFIHGTCEEWLLAARDEIPHTPVACMIDPPREGLSEIVRTDLLSSDADFCQILYLSCNPSTLARDLLALSPKWTPVSFQPLDLFPRTAHLECLVSLAPTAKA